LRVTAISCNNRQSNAERWRIYLAKKKEQTIDWDRLSLPSDRITFKQIRRHNKDLLYQDQSNDYEKCDGRLFCEFDVWSIFSAERDIATRAFSKAVGQPDPIPAERDSAFLLWALDAVYKDYGISNGASTTRELMRKIESDAAAQAKGTGTPG
jgi:hypothetical protein